MPLLSNKGKSFQGSIVLGKGFILTPEEALALIDKDPRNKEVLFPYLNGDDLNNSPTQEPSRWVINFFDWSEEKARSYPDCFDIVERLVKPERLIQKDKGGKEKWWQFLRPRKELYATISELDLVMVLTRVSKYVVVEIVNKRQVFMEKLVVKTFKDPFYFGVLQSNIYNEWAWKYSSTLGSGTINYSPSVCFETFPFPVKNEDDLLNSIILDFYYLRKDLMKKSQMGLTKLYNQIHNQKLKAIQDHNIENTLFMKDYGKESLYLKKHLEKKSKLKFNEVVSTIENLRQFQIKIDTEILALYHWSDIELRHNFYPVDYLPETDRIRFSIHPDARKEILSRLLKLNKKIHSTE